MFICIYTHIHQCKTKTGQFCEMSNLNFHLPRRFFCLVDHQIPFPPFTTFNYMRRSKLHCITKVVGAFHHLTWFSHDPGTMDQKIPYDDYQLPVVFLPSYENPPAWIPAQEVMMLNFFQRLLFGCCLYHL